MTAQDRADLRAALRGLLAASGSSHAEIRNALHGDGWLDDAYAAPLSASVWPIIAEEMTAALASLHVVDVYLGGTLVPDSPDLPVAYIVGDVLDRPPRTSRTGFVRGGAPDADAVLVIDDTAADAPRAFIVPTIALPRTADAGIDPSRGTEQVSWVGPDARAVAIDPETLAGALAGAHTIQARVLLTLCRSMMSLARDHTLVRKQFGAPIASFQAVKHLLAECAVDIEAARAVLEFAEDTGDPIAGRTARALAGRSTGTVGRAAQQVTGAMGFSWEWPLHHHVERAHTEELRLGPWQHVARSIGESIIARGSVPLIAGA